MYRPLLVLLPLILVSRAVAAQETSPSASPTPTPLSTPPPVSVELPEFGAVTLGGYGEAYYDREQGGGNDSAHATLRRVVLYVGHRFDEQIRFYSEFEVENAVDAEFEQGYLDYAVSSTLAIRAGLQLVPMGIINITHEPPTFLTVDRPFTDQLIIPSTWRELGIVVVAEPVEDLKLTGMVANGLDGDQINGDTGLVLARGQGAGAHAQQPSVSARAQYEPVLGLVLGASGYAGGARADIAALTGVNVGIGEADLQWHDHGVYLRAEYARVWISNAQNLTLLARATNPLADAIGSAFEGYYGELGYDLLHLAAPASRMALIPFARFESVNLRAQTADVPNPGDSRPKTFFGAGVDWKLNPRVVLKADWRHFLGSGAVPLTGDLEEAGTGEGVSPAPGGNDRFMLGIGFSF